MKNYLLVSCFTATVLLFSHCARNPVTGKRQLTLISEEQEIAMGKEADPQIIAEYGLYEDASLQSFINQKGKEMTAISHRPNLNYQFRIVNSNILNAFAVPGGYVYFTRGIMAHFNSEAEFAGVLGHEIGHITARHSVTRESKAMLGQIGLAGAMVVSPTVAQFGNVASQGMGLLFLKFGRDAERQSDDLGVEYSSKIGYDAQQMAEFFTVLQREGEQNGSAELPTFLSTHPNPGDRHVDVAKKATEWKQKLNLTSPKINRNEYLRRIEGLIYGDDPREGFVESNMFYHPGLRFQVSVPANWNLQNTPQKVNMAPQDGKALMFMTLAQGTSLQQAASTTMQQYQLKTMGSRETTVNGLPALIVEAQQQQQQGGIVNALSCFIQYNNAVYHIIGVTSQADYQTYSTTFNNVMQSFRQLTDQTKLNRQPERIRIKTVGQTATLQQVLHGFNVPDKRLEELALLNGMHLTDQVQKGMLIKILGQ